MARSDALPLMPLVRALLATREWVRLGLDQNPGSGFTEINMHDVERLLTSLIDALHGELEQPE